MPVRCLRAALGRALAGCQAKAKNPEPVARNDDLAWAVLICLGVALAALLWVRHCGRRRRAGRVQPSSNEQAQQQQHDDGGGSAGSDGGERGDKEKGTRKGEHDPRAHNDGVAVAVVAGGCCLGTLRLVPAAAGCPTPTMTGSEAMSPEARRAFASNY